MTAINRDSCDLFSSAASIYAYIGRNLDGLKLDTTASAFSECVSDRSIEFSVGSSSRNLLETAFTEDEAEGNDATAQLVANLESDSLEAQRKAVMQIRLLAKCSMENRIRIADAGGIRPLVQLAQSADAQIQELAVTAILNLSLCDENRDQIVGAGAARALVKAIRTGTRTAMENAACAILRLSHQDDVKSAIGRAGAIPPLISLLESGTLRGKKDALGALYALTTVKENKARAVEAGVVRPLVDLMADMDSGMVDKAELVTLNLVSTREARVALVDEGGIPVLVEVVEVGTQRQKEFAVGILLELCEDNTRNRGLVAREGAIPPIVALSQSGTSRATRKAETLTQYLRQPRSGGNGARGVGNIRLIYGFGRPAGGGDKLQSTEEKRNGTRFVRLMTCTYVSHRDHAMYFFMCSFSSVGN